MVMGGRGREMGDGMEDVGWRRVDMREVWCEMKD